MGKSEYFVCNLYSFACIAFRQNFSYYNVFILIQEYRKEVLWWEMQIVSLPRVHTTMYSHFSSSIENTCSTTCWNTYSHPKNIHSTAISEIGFTYFWKMQLRKKERVRINLWRKEVQLKKKTLCMKIIQKCLILNDVSNTYFAHLV